jgi:hypothetical protein
MAHGEVKGDRAVVLMQRIGDLDARTHPIDVVLIPKLCAVKSEKVRSRTRTSCWHFTRRPRHGS